MTFFFGVLGFLLLYTYEANQILWHKSFIKVFFTLGFMLIIYSTSSVFLAEIKFINIDSFMFLSGIICFTTFLGLLIYTLFFAIPFTDSYVSQFKHREVYSEKMYALSRHPGVLWFIGVYLSLVMILPTQRVIILGVVLSSLNVIYVLIQDIWSFPKLFVDYDDYKRSTPFLCPTFKSVSKTIKSIKGR